MTRTTEDSIEKMALSQLEALGFDVAHGPDIAFDGPNPERNLGCPSNILDTHLVVE